MDAPPTTQQNYRCRLEIAYDGTAFNGWGVQPGLRTVQGELEAVLARIFRRHTPWPRLIVAGRTDAGVHAAAQVAHLDLSGAQLDSLARRRGRPDPEHVGVSRRELALTLADRLNGVLEQYADIRVVSSEMAPDGFDARYSALWRRYEYRLADATGTRDPLQRLRTTWHPFALDVDVMNAAAATLLGLHDFAAFCKARSGATTIRTLQSFRWHREDDGVLIASVVADAFCHSMVRSLVGACVAAGEGSLNVDTMPNLLGAVGRGEEFNVMPARGLTLIEIGYPDPSEFAGRAAITRALRQL